ncbi:hypothetical protein GS538_20345 [Rhodococcus hoagii]|nr:hypothetical protein [Prescottella equi]NKS71546.1 hypothetical protein [Prescottella equi]
MPATATPGHVLLIETCLKIAANNSDTPIADVAASIDTIENDEHRAQRIDAFDQIAGTGAFARYTDPRTAIQRLCDTAAENGWDADIYNTSQVAVFFRNDERITVLCNVTGETVRGARHNDGRVIGRHDARKADAIIAWLTAR